MKFQLVVKGDIFDALAAARVKLPEGCKIPKVAELWGGSETALDVADYPSDSHAVWEWFNEPGSAPFPTGSLLHFSIQGGN